MQLIYTLFIHLVSLGYTLAATFNHKAKLFTSGREDLFTNIKLAFTENDSPVIWIHASSLGEFEQGRPLIEQFKNEFPDHKILLTFFSPSGYEVRKKYDKADFVFYLPWDTPQNAKQFIDICNPVLAIFVKYEFWFHFADQLKKRNIPLLSISTIFRPQQIFFRSFGGFNRKILQNFSWFFVQNEESVKLLASINLKNVTLSGDTRFDRVSQLVKQVDEVSAVKDFKDEEKIMVIGSCWPEDLEILIPFMNENKSFLKFIIALHEINEPMLSSIEKNIQGKAIRYSQVVNAIREYQVLLIDNVGMLGKLYRYGEFAYVGGAFGKGLHNILEAACYGIPIFFGNRNYQKFQEAVDLINRGGAFDVSSHNDLKEKFKMINTPENYMLACDVTQSYVQENLGATEKIMQYCRPILES